MRHLPLPATPAEDDGVLESLCAQPAWAPYKEAWLTAYALYRAGKGSPFAVLPLGLPADVASRQYALYDSRKSTSALRKLRQQPGLLSCPVCGSPVTGSLDHHLPRTAYPEFAILRINLVPACMHCNSGVKGDITSGENGERLIHPYFDTWASEPLWEVEIVPPFKSATFRPVPAAALGERELVIKFHLQNVLGDQFERSVTNRWSTYPNEVLIKTADLDITSFNGLVQMDLRLAIATNGVNSWTAAFFRGLVHDDTALEFLRKTACDLLLREAAA